MSRNFVIIVALIVAVATLSILLIYDNPDRSNKWGFGVQEAYLWNGYWKDCEKMGGEKITWTKVPNLGFKSFSFCVVK